MINKMKERLTAEELLVNEIVEQDLNFNYYLSGILPSNEEIAEVVKIAKKLVKGVYGTNDTSKSTKDGRRIVYPLQEDGRYRKLRTIS